MRRHRAAAAVALATTTAVLAAGAGPAAARPGPPSAPPTATPATVAQGLAGPLSFDVAPGGDLYVGEAFAGALTLVPRRGDAQQLVVTPGVEVAAVSVAPGGRTTFAETTYGEDGPPTSAVLKQLGRDGTVSVLADLLAYEQAENPDGDVAYGFLGLTPECAGQLPPFVQPYTGIIESHPYGSASRGRTTYVADAAANAVLEVDRAGEVSTVAVLPPTVVEVTADIAAAQGLPECVVGLDYALESVPTDVEIGRGGQLYVSTLPGGPEDGSLGANGSVYRVDPRTGATTLVATGFMGATGVAAAPDGTLYVAELFGGQVSAISRTGEVAPVAQLDTPAAVEFSRGRLYVATNAFGPGEIVTLRTR